MIELRDGQEYPIASIAANSSQSYFFTHRSPRFGRILYQVIERLNSEEVDRATLSLQYWANSIGVYPTFAESDILISLPEILDKVTVTVLDMTSKVLLSHQINATDKIDCSRLQQGMYIIQITSYYEIIHTEKVIKI